MRTFGNGWAVFTGSCRGYGRCGTGGNAKRSTRLLPVNSLFAEDKDRA